MIYYIILSFSRAFYHLCGIKETWDPYIQLENLLNTKSSLLSLSFNQKTTAKAQGLFQRRRRENIIVSFVSEIIFRLPELTIRKTTELFFFLNTQLIEKFHMKKEKTAENMDYNDFAKITKISLVWKTSSHQKWFLYRASWRSLTFRVRFNLHNWWLLLSLCMCSRLFIQELLKKNLNI